MSSLPPIEWFQDPDLNELTPLTVTDEGRVYGHLAGWGVKHRGLNGNVTAPHSRTDYAEFLLHSVRVADGDKIRTLAVGNLTAGAGHAAMDLTSDGAKEHYDSAASVVAQVITGEDRFGIWYAGAVLPDVDELQLRRFMSCGLSGDWRRSDKTGGLELVAALSVPVPGFATPRSRVASGVPLALVAAGMVPPTQVDLGSFGHQVDSSWASPTADKSLVATAAVDYDQLADAIADRMDGRQQARELAIRHLSLVTELDDTPAVVASLLAEVDDMPCLVAGLLNELDGDTLVAVAGRELSPKDVQSTERLMEYWAHGEGAAKVHWGEPNDFYRCRDHLAKYVPPGDTLDGLCANLHHRALGVWPGQEDGKK